MDGFYTYLSITCKCVCVYDFVYEARDTKGYTYSQWTVYLNITKITMCIYIQ